MPAGLRIVRTGHTVGWIRDDLLRRCERCLLATVRHHNEVHRTFAVDGARFHRTLDAHMDSHRVEASSEQSQVVLHHIRTVGRG